MSKKENIISIIIPVYDVEKYIDKCFESIHKQSYKNFEVIIINDGSPDNVEEICLKWIKKDKRFKYYKQKNMGVSVARNNGIEKTTGNFITFVDPDDYVDSKFLEIMYKSLKKNKSDISICNYYIVNTNNEKKEIIKHKSNIYNKMQHQKNLIALDFYKGFSWNKLYCKNILLNEVGNFIKFEKDMKCREDLMFNLVVSKRINKVSYISKPLYYYYQRNDSAIRTSNVIDTLKSYKILNQFVTDNKIDEGSFFKSAYIYTYIKNNISKKDDSAYDEFKNYYKMIFKFNIIFNKFFNYFLRKEIKKKLIYIKSKIKFILKI